MSGGKKHQMCCEQSSVYMNMLQLYRFPFHSFATAMDGLLGRDTQARGMTRAGLALMDGYMMPWVIHEDAS